MLRLPALCKGFLKLAILLLCLSMLVLPVFAQSQPEGVSACPVYSYASLGAPVIGRLETGCAVTVLAEDGDYYRIDCYGMTGFLPKTHTRKAPDGSVLADCPEAQAQTLPQCTLPELLAFRSELLSRAQAQLGTPYVYGGKAPGGFDCSGFTSYLYARQGISLHRCADEQLQDGLIVPRENLQPGDLLFFRESGCPWLASHVGIYAGDGMMLHAGSGGICYSRLDSGYFLDTYIGARRVLRVQTAGTETLQTAADSLKTRSAGSGLRTAP